MASIGQVLCHPPKKVDQALAFISKFSGLMGPRFGFFKPYLVTKVNNLKGLKFSTHWLIIQINIFIFFYSNSKIWQVTYQ